MVSLAPSARSWRAAFEFGSALDTSRGASEHHLLTEILYSYAAIAYCVHDIHAVHGLGSCTCHARASANAAVSDAEWRAYMTLSARVHLYDMAH